jgi:hypothetical protein
MPLLRRRKSFTKGIKFDPEKDKKPGQVASVIMGQTMVRRDLDSRLRRQARLTEKTRMRLLFEPQKKGDKPVLTTADMADFQQAVRIYNLQRLEKGLRLGGGKKGGVLMPGYELNWKAINPLRFAGGPWGPGGPRGPFVTIFVYPIMAGIRIIMLPFTVSGRLAARIIKMQGVKKELNQFKRDIEKSLREDGKPLSVQMYLAYFEEVDQKAKKATGHIKDKEKREKAFIKERSKKWSKLAERSPTEGDWLKKRREARNARRQRAAA